MWPGNGEGLVWFRLFINLSLTYLDTYPLNYSPATHTGLQRQYSILTGSEQKTEKINTDRKDATYRGRVDLVTPDVTAVRTVSRLWCMSVVVTVPASNNCNCSSNHDQ